MPSKSVIILAAWLALIANPVAGLPCGLNVCFCLIVLVVQSISHVSRYLLQVHAIDTRLDSRAAAVRGGNRLVGMALESVEALPYDLLLTISRNVVVRLILRVVKVLPASSDDLRRCYVLRQRARRVTVVGVELVRLGLIDAHGAALGDEVPLRSSGLMR